MYFFIRIVWRQKLKHGNKEATTFTVNVGCVQQFLVAKNRQIATKQLLKNANIIRKNTITEEYWKIVLKVVIALFIQNNRTFQQR